MELTLRPARALPMPLGGLLIAVGLFWALHQLTAGHTAALRSEPLAALDFVRLRHDVAPETLQRSKPPRPQPPRTPPTPRLQVATTAAPPSTPVDVTLPAVPLSGSVTGPFVQFAAAGAVTQGDAELVPLVRIAPQYPQKAARDGVEGQVTLQISVGADGGVTDVRVVSATPRGYFESVAVAAAFKGRFRPRVVDGHAQATSGTYTVRFGLQRE